MKGKVIVVDGADATGKQTQTELLVSRINSSGILQENKAHYITFPNYSGLWGRVIKEIYLSGEMGDLKDISPVAASLLYVADRAQKAEQINDILLKGDWIIFDRYVQSNFTYQGVRLNNTEERDNLISILEKIEYEYMNLPRPDKVIILELENKIRFQRSHDRGDEDIHEKNHGYMTSVSAEYKRLAEKFSWEVVNCSFEGRQLSIEEISDLIWKIVIDEFDEEHFLSV